MRRKKEKAEREAEKNERKLESKFQFHRVSYIIQALDYRE